MIQALIDKIRNATAKGSITPEVLGNALTEMHNEQRQISIYINEDGINVTGAAKLIEQGYRPVLFRYNRKVCTTKLGEEDNDDHRERYAKVRGWNVFYSQDQIKFEGNLATFRAIENSTLIEAEYYAWPQALFKSPVVITGEDPYDLEVRIPFGSKSKHLKKGRQYRQFRFGIAFTRPGYFKQSNEPLDYTALSTNIAEFRVNMFLDLSGDGKVWLSYHFSL